MRLYVSGGMTGWPNNNEDAFDQAEQVLTAMGHDVTTPVELGRKDGETLEGDGFTATDEEYEGFLERDLALISRDNFDAIVFIRGWTNSGGAGREGRKAIEEGLQMFTLDVGEYHVYLDPIYTHAFLERSVTSRLRPSEVV